MISPTGPRAFAPVSTAATRLELIQRLTWLYGAEEAERRLIDLNRGTDPDLIAWENLGRHK